MPACDVSVLPLVLIVTANCEVVCVCIGCMEMNSGDTADMTGGTELFRDKG